MGVMCLQTKKWQQLPESSEGSTLSIPCFWLSDIYFRLLASGTWKNCFLLFKASKFVIVCYSSHGKLTQEQKLFYTATYRQILWFPNRNHLSRNQSNGHRSGYRGITSKSVVINTWVEKSDNPNLKEMRYPESRKTLQKKKKGIKLELEKHRRRHRPRVTLNNDVSFLQLLY